MVYHVSMTAKQESFIRSLDRKVLGAVLEVSPTFSGRQGTVFNCYCPFCHGDRRNHSKLSAAPHATANVFNHRNGEGLSFGCAACGKVVYSVHQLLCEIGRSDVADWYATKRWEYDKACGMGWTCPLPQDVAQSFSDARLRKKQEDAAKRTFHRNP